MICMDGEARALKRTTNKNTFVTKDQNEY